MDHVLNPWLVANDGYSVLGICALLLVFAAAYLVSLAVYRIWFHPLSVFPGPPLLAAFYAPYVYHNYLRGTWTVQTVGKLHRRYGNVVRIGPNHLAVDGAVAWPQVYGHRRQGQQEFAKLAGVSVGENHSITDAPLELHRRLRRHLGEAFRDSATAAHEPRFALHADLLLRRLEERADRAEVVNIVDWLTFDAFDTFGDFALSEAFGCLDKADYHPWVLEIGQGIRGMSTRRAYQCYPVLGLIADSFSVKRQAQHLWDFRKSVRAVAAELTEQKKDAIDGKQDLLTHMMQKRHGVDAMSMPEIMENIPIFVLAGSETNANSLCGFFFHVLQHPNVYETLTREIRTAFKAEEDISFRSVPRLEYMQAAINEALRIYPPGAELPARTSPGTCIEGKYVPEGARISVHQYSTFRNPEHFVDPESFIPERWLSKEHPLYDARFRDENKAVFKPFSAGPRDCMGKALAMHHLRYTIARILYRLDMTPCPGQEGWQEDQTVRLSWVKGPLYVRLRRCAA
ncbi:hypothetical protein JDV02_000870 [Purpureocillium takamizusanense]|uniref:Cytochrome P450 n=1 Tax=Purpureocillium takamizusanense TaxID=2060973 RepID=A0A9Q8Q7Z2_9HYPO|nr:uncharacterized protein JDV02_000870 [Purpureocillium takamizusanense]UNI14219.1 hypothetical protein JDV02_000870 [Purpureocillium takamizusanense]